MNVKVYKRHGISLFLFQILLSVLCFLLLMFRLLYVYIPAFYCLYSDFSFISYYTIETEKTKVSFTDGVKLNPLKKRPCFQGRLSAYRLTVTDNSYNIDCGAAPAGQKHRLSQTANSNLTVVQHMFYKTDLYNQYFLVHRHTVCKP